MVLALLKQVMRPRRISAIVLVWLVLSNCLLAAEGSKRVLVVTTEQDTPAIYAAQNGEAVITDLAAGGYPFDVVTYERFVNMAFDASDNHDIIILNGHTSPTPVILVAKKCQQALQSGRKVFINGHLPYSRYDKNGKVIERVTYCDKLYSVTYDQHWVCGGATVPEGIEKDPTITAVGLICKNVHTFSLDNPPEMTITIKRHTVGFLGAQGGAIDGSSDYLLSVLDYSKVVSYLRYGDTGIVGFANDRIRGKPIVSFEVHCDSTNDIIAIDAIEALANELQIPLMNLLVYEKLTRDSVARWNDVSGNHLLAIGSHSRTHPFDWPTVSDFYSETGGALALQRSQLSATRNYFNFSGSMNPTTSQIDQLYRSDVIFGAKGAELRQFRLPFGVPWHHYRHDLLKRLAWKTLIRIISPITVQVIPTNKDWFTALSRSSTTPFCLSQTLQNDYSAWRGQRNYLEEIKASFAMNRKYGLYSYGYIHDYMLNLRNEKFQTNGVHMSLQIKSALQYLKSQDVVFILTDDLIRRLRDFITGWIDYEITANGSYQVTVHRPSSMANQVKIECRENLVAIASGNSVLSQVRVGKMLYVDLEPAIESTFKVRFLEDAAGLSK